MYSKRDLSRLILPLIAEEVFMGLIGIVDIVMVARLGENAVSGLSLIDSLNLLVLSVFSAVANGGAILVSQYLGRKDNAGAQSAATQSAWLMLLFSTGIAAICFLGNRAMLQFLYGAADAAVLTAAERYFYLIAASYPFVGLYKVGTAIFRAMGNTRISMNTSLLMNVSNVALNALFIFGMQMGVVGAALGTFFSRAFGMLAVMVLLVKNREPVTFSGLHRVRLKKQMVQSLLFLSIPTGLENSIFHVGKLLVQRVVTSFGTTAIAANAVALTITEFTHMPAAAIGVAMITVIGHCVGAKEYGQAKRYMRSLLGVAYALTAFVCTITLLFTPQIVGIYHLEAETAAIAINILRLHGVVCALVWPTGFCLPRGLQAAGDVRYTMLVSVSVMWIFRVGFSLLFARIIPQVGVLGVWMALSLDWIVRAGLFLWRYLSEKWKNVQVIRESA